MCHSITNTTFCENLQYQENIIYCVSNVVYMNVGEILSIKAPVCSTAKDPLETYKHIHTHIWNTSAMCKPSFKPEPPRLFRDADRRLFSFIQ